MLPSRVRATRIGQITSSVVPMGGSPARSSVTGCPGDVGEPQTQSVVSQLLYDLFAIRHQDRVL